MQQERLLRVSKIPENTNPINPIESVCEWLRRMGERGIYSPESSRQRISALRQIVKVLADDEPKDIHSLLANVEGLGARWATANSGNPATAKRYIRRAKVSLEGYLEYERDPVNFKPQSRVPSTKKKSDKSAKRSATKPTPAMKEREDASASPAIRETQYPIPNTDKVFSYGFSERLEMRDLPAIMVHLASITKDFNPMMLAGWVSGMRSTQESTVTTIVPE